MVTRSATRGKAAKRGRPARAALFALASLGAVSVSSCDTLTVNEACEVSCEECKKVEMRCDIAGDRKQAKSPAGVPL